MLCRCDYKTSSIVSHVRKSQPSSELLQDDNRLQAMMPCWWNSQRKMVRSVLNVPANIMDTIPSKNTLTQGDRFVLEGFVAVMTPFEQATAIKTLATSMLQQAWSFPRFLA